MFIWPSKEKFSDTCTFNRTEGPESESELESESDNRYCPESDDGTSDSTALVWTPSLPGAKQHWIGGDLEQGQPKFFKVTAKNRRRNVWSFKMLTKPEARRHWKTCVVHVNSSVVMWVAVYASDFDNIWCRLRCALRNKPFNFCFLPLDTRYMAAQMRRVNQITNQMLSFLLIINWLIVSYDSANEQKRYKKPSYKEATNSRWKLEFITFT